MSCEAAVSCLKKGKTMITDSFDIKSEAILTPQAFLGEQKQFSRLAVGTFSREIYAEALKRYPHEQIGEIRAANMVKPLHLIRAEGMEIVFYLSEIGSSLASVDVIEINWMSGAENFILFGSAGSLDRDKTSGRYVIPTAAYRDEGTSYHYAPPADYIAVPGADLVAEVFDEAHIPYIKGRVWTTDAPYRETRGHVARRKEEGCLAVEMELAGVQAACDFYGFRLFDFLQTGDVVDQPEYTPEGLHEANHALDKLDIALRIAKRVLAQFAGEETIL